MGSGLGRVDDRRARLRAGGAAHVGISLWHRMRLCAFCGPRWRPGGLPNRSLLFLSHSVVCVLLAVRWFILEAPYQRQTQDRPTGKSPQPPSPSGPAHYDFLASLTWFGKINGIFVLTSKLRPVAGEAWCSLWAPASVCGRKHSRPRESKQDVLSLHHWMVRAFAK